MNNLATKLELLHILKLTHLSIPLNSKQGGDIVSAQRMRDVFEKQQQLMLP